MSYATDDQMLAIEPLASTSPDETHSALVITQDYFYDDIVFAGSVYIDEQLRTGSDPNPWETAWLVWNYTDNEHFYYFALKTNGWELGKRDPSYEGGQRFLASGESTTFETKTWYDFRIEQHGATMTVSIGGKEIVTFTDEENAYTGGKLGIYAEDARVFLDDVTGSTTDDFDGYELQSLQDGSQLGTAWEVAFLGYGEGGIVNDTNIGIVATGSNRVDDTLVGGVGNDSLSGLGGNDLLIGGGGADTLDGGAGKLDRAGYDNDGSVMVDLDDAGQNTGAARGDVFISIEEWAGSSGNDTLLGGETIADRLFGQNGDDQLTGRGGDDRLFGEAGNDGLDGGSGRDQLFGGMGNDILTGGLDGDALYGEAGADTFVYRDLLDSGVGNSNRDVIGDFNRGADKIDLSAIDADGDAGNGDTAFIFAGTGFSGAGAEVRVYRARKNAVVELDVDGDHNPDAQILVSSLSGLTAADFLL